MKHITRYFPFILFMLFPVLLLPDPVHAETAEEAQARKNAYVNAIRAFADQRVFPDGMAVGDVLEDPVFRENHFAVCDVDEDGDPELLFKYDNGFMAECVERIYDYDAASNTL